ncbi:MAG: NPCBM/NEW2 domain-containing protein [Candidatus Omnitrophota bacterium]|nr:NPCBM/NEW2 domain-containing protein [Candidatus Omnitrophota bacterium]
MNLIRNKLLIYGLLALAVAFNLFFLSRIIWGSEPNGDDNSYHLANIYFQKEVLAKDPLNYLDSWCDYWNMGFPINHYYHHLSYLVMGLASFIFHGIPVYKLFNLSIVILFSALPLSIYAGLRYMGFNPYAAVFSALVSTLIECSLSHGGLNLSSFLGSGLYTQLWAIIMLPIATASSYYAMANKKGYLRSAFFIALTFLFNSIVGFVALVNAVIFVFQTSDTLALSLGEFKKRGKILLAILAVFLIFASYWIIPFMLNSGYNGGEPFGTKESMQSYGYTKIMQELFSGRLFDYNHKIPFLTPLLFIGILFAVARKDARYRTAAVSFFVWLVIFYGLTPMLAFFKKLPFGGMLPLSRSVIALHFWAVVLCGIGLSELIRPGNFFGRFNKSAQVLKIAGIIIIFFLVYKEMGLSIQDKARTFNDFNPYHDYRREFVIFKDYMSGLPDGRIYMKGQTGHGSHWLAGLTPAYSNRPVIAGYSSAAGLESLSFYYVEGVYPAVLSHYGLFNLKYIVSTPEMRWPGFCRKVYESYPFAIWEVKASGYFDLVNAPLLLVGDKENVRAMNRDWMQSRLPANKEFMLISPDKGQVKRFNNYIMPDSSGQVHSLWLKGSPQVAKITNNLQILSRLSAAGEHNFGALSAERRGINTYSVEADVRKECFVLLKTTFHPNWHVYVNGTEKEKVMLSPAFMGVKLPPGKYQIIFKYRAGLLRWWLFIIAFILGWLSWKSKNADAIINSWLFERRFKRARIIALVLLGLSVLAAYQCNSKKESQQGIAYLSDYNEEMPMPNYAYLSDLAFVSAKQDDGVLARDRSYQGHILSLGGKMYDKGLGTQSNSEVTYHIAGFTEFRAVIGLDDELSGLYPNYASVIFKVYLDNKLAFESPVFYQATPSREIALPLNGAKGLRLVVTDAGSGSPDGNLIWGDHADWADAKLLK